MKAIIKEGQKLTTRSACDHDCIFKLTVTSRKGNFATIEYMGNTRRTKVYSDLNRDEYLHPDKYSMSPIFRATKP